MPPNTSSAAGVNSSSKVAKPIKRTPVVLQMHASECGAACLGMILGYFGRWVPLTELREVCEVSRDGSSAASLSRAAKHYGLECSGQFLTIGNLQKLDFPIILFWQFSHFVVLDGFDERYYYLNDPATGHRRVTHDEFAASFSGVALKIKPGANFKAGGQPPGLFNQLNKMLDGSWNAVAGAAACALMLAVLMLVMPVSLEIFVDSVLENQGPWSGLVTALVGGGVLVYILSLLKQRLLRRLEVKISISGHNRSLSRLLRLPINFFQHRLDGDLTERVSSINRIAKNLTNQFLALVIDVAMSVVLLIAMFAYNTQLALMVSGLALLYALLAWLINQRLVILNYTKHREQGILLGMGIQLLSHTEQVRMTGSGDRSFQLWSGQQASELRARRRTCELDSVNAALPTLFEMLCAAVVLGFGSSLVLDGTISLGTLVGFFILALLFLTPVGRFVEFSNQRQMLVTDLQRYDDILSTAEDSLVSRRDSQSDSISTHKGRLQLAGYLELKNISFGYSKNRPLIKDFSLVIEPGQRVAVVGPSGSGKSTLAHLVSGTCKPWSGEILYDGKPRHEIPEQVMEQSISMVDQNVVLFTASLRDNITLWHPEVPDEVVFQAARDARIHDEILVRPQGYETMVTSNGANFSGGQRQRIEIARALVGGPTLLILDEATSALDAATEEQIDNALRRRGVSCLIVAHRLSTIRDCDEIIVVVNGLVEQRGTHNELFADRDGVYHKLFTAE